VLRPNGFDAFFLYQGKIKQRSKKVKKYICKLLLAAVIIVQIAYTINIFASEKQGIHGEETQSYRIANGHSREVYAESRWIAGNELKDSVTVQRGERFSYGRVYSDSGKSLNPPLYYLLLHTVCSFFPEKFSLWYGLAIGLLCLIGTQIFLFLTVQKITASETAAFSACLLYGGGKGALCTFTFISPFCTAAMFGMMFTYTSACCFEDVKNSGKMVKKHIVSTAVAACALFLSQYEGILYAAPFAAAFAAYLLCKRKGKAALVYTAGAVAGFAAALALDPSAVRQIAAFERPEVTSFSPAVQIRILLSYLFQYNYGFKIGYFPTAFWNIALPVIAAVLVAAVALLLPFRDEEWFWRLIGRLKKAALSVKTWIGRADYTLLFAMAGCVTIYEAVAHSVDVFLNGDFVMRYTCIAVAPVAMTAVVAFHRVFSGILKREKVLQAVMFLVICGVLVRVHLSTGYPYSLRQMPEEADLFQETEGKNVLVAGVSSKAVETDSLYFLPELYGADAVYFTVVPAAGEEIDENGFETRKIDYVIVDARALQGAEETESDFADRATELIRKATQDADWDAVAVKQGENRYYYVLKMK